MFYKKYIIGFLSLAFGVTSFPASPAIAANSSGDLPLIRLYNAKFQDHFYTNNRAEADGASRSGYRIEGELGYLSSKESTDTIPIFRLYNFRAKKHFYTTSREEMLAVTQRGGFQLEGALGFLPKESSGATNLSIFRLYNPQNGNHLYTTNSSERDAATRIGFINEGALSGYLYSGTQATPVKPGPQSPTPPVTSNCPIYPADNAWNTPINNAPIHSNSSAFISSIGLNNKLHPDFGETQTYGIPYVIVDKNQSKVPIHFTAYGDESDPGPYPIPANAPRETSSDHHVIVLDKDNCLLYELFNASKNNDNSWNADSGAIFNLKSNALRPDYWTSADAAGLPVYPGLVKYEEVASGKINHAIRFTAPRSQKGFIHPATHFAGSNDNSLPPMGLRVRLKANYDISKLPYQAKVIAEAMKTYGMILADNGSAWYFTGAPSTGWNDNELNTLKAIPGSAFEVVDTGPIIK
jgi:hypothetical protein